MSGAENEPYGDRERLGRDLSAEDRVRDDRRDEPEGHQRHEGPGDRPGEEAPIEPQGGEAAHHPRFNCTSWRPLDVQAFIPPSRLSMVV